LDVYTCIRSKRDTRAYQDKPISEDTLGRILQAGRMAGSAKNFQP
jgi:nitroreductase